MMSKIDSATIISLVVSQNIFTAKNFNRRHLNHSLHLKMFSIFEISYNSHHFVNRLFRPFCSPVRFHREYLWYFSTSWPKTSVFSYSGVFVPCDLRPSTCRFSSRASHVNPHPSLLIDFMELKTHKKKMRNIEKYQRYQTGG